MDLMTLAAESNRCGETAQARTDNNYLEWPWVVMDKWVARCAVCGRMHLPVRHSIGRPVGRTRGRQDRVLLDRVSGSHHWMVLDRVDRWYIRTVLVSRRWSVPGREGKIELEGQKKGVI